MFFLIGGMKMRKKVNKISIILVAIIAVIFAALWFTGIIGLWIHGMAYIADNTKTFTDTEGYVVQGEYSISINLDDLQSNLGKELYNDGSSKIYVSFIDNTGSTNTGGYEIGFRSSGEYSLSQATLVSGIHHKTVDESSFTMDMSAKMTAKYNGKIYISKEYGTSGLNYKDGDDFSFYIFPIEAYEKGEISLQEKGTVQLTVTNLYKNMWTKK